MSEQPMTDEDRRRVLEIIAGLHRNEAALAQHWPGGPLTQHLNGPGQPDFARE